MSPRSLEPLAVAVPPLPMLLGADDPPPLVQLNVAGSARLLLVCDHASRAFPAALGRLGVPESALDMHIAYDIGAAQVTRRLSRLLDAPALLGSYSRLVLDLNRGLDESSLIPEVSDGVVIPGNLGLSDADREARIEALHRPWHRAVASELRRLHARHGRPALLVGIHSFTPVMDGFVRPWHVGVLWDSDEAIAHALMAALAAPGDLCVGDNEPYSGREPSGGTLEAHATDHGLPGISFEIRQDLVSDDAGCEAWAERLAEVLRPLV